MDNAPYVSILRDVFHVQDVSAVEGERARAHAVPELSGAFEQLGFRSIGFYRMGSPPGYVHEVWRSPDSRAFLTLEHDKNNKPRAELRTMLHDGTIIDTSSSHSGLARLYRRARIHHPESSYLMETSSGSPEVLWRKHAERLESILRERGSIIPPHDSMRMQFALTSRSMLVTFVRRLQGRRLEWTVFIPATLAIVAAVVFAGTPIHWLTATAVVGVALWYIGEFSTWLAARLMSLPAVSLASLLAAVDMASTARPPELTP